MQIKLKIVKIVIKHAKLVADQAIRIAYPVVFLLSF
jgi:hypothetical protein